MCSLQRNIGTRTPAVHHPVSLLSHFFGSIKSCCDNNLMLRFLLSNLLYCPFASMKEIENKDGPLFSSGPLMDSVSWYVPWMDQWHFWTFPRMNLEIHSARRKRYSKHSENLWSYLRDVLIQLKYWTVCRLKRSDWFPYYRKMGSCLLYKSLKKSSQEMSLWNEFLFWKKVYLENIHLLTLHYTFEVIIWPRKQGVGASKHFKITLWLAYMQVFLNWLLLAVFNSHCY